MFGVRHTQNGYALFNLDNNYIGHFESDSQNGYNQFDEKNDWVAFVK